MHFRILKMIATSGFLTALECTKFDFGPGFAPDPAGGAYIVPPVPLAGLRGLLLRGEGRKGGREGEGRGRGIRRDRERGKWNTPPSISAYAHKRPRVYAYVC